MVYINARAVYMNATVVFVNARGVYSFPHCEGNFFPRIFQLFTGKKRTFPPRGAAGRFSGNKLRREARDIRHFPYIRGGKYF